MKLLFSYCSEGRYGNLGWSFISHFELMNMILNTIQFDVELYSKNVNNKIIFIVTFCCQINS